MGSFRQNDYFAIAEMILKGKYITLALLACKILVFISLNRDLSLHSGAAIYVWGENKRLSINVFRHSCEKLSKFYHAIRLEKMQLTLHTFCRLYN